MLPSLRSARRFFIDLTQTKCLRHRKVRRAEPESNDRMDTANRLRRTAAQLGWPDTLCYCLDRLLARIGWRLRKYYFVAQPTAQATTPARSGLHRAALPERGGAFTIRLASGGADVPLTHPRPRAVICRRFAQGAQTLQAWRGEQLAGFLWFLPNAYQEDEVRARYRLASPQSLWDFDVYVAPEYRLGPLFRRLWSEAHVMMRSQDVRWTCSRISAYNPASRGAHARLGAVTLGAAVFLSCGEWQWTFATQAPYFHLSRHPAAFPELLFDTSTLEAGATPEPPCPVSTN